MRSNPLSAGSPQNEVFGEQWSVDADDLHGMHDYRIQKELDADVDATLDPDYVSVMEMKSDLDRQRYPTQCTGTTLERYEPMLTDFDAGGLSGPDDEQLGQLEAQLERCSQQVEQRVAEARRLQVQVEEHRLLTV